LKSHSALKRYTVDLYSDGPDPVATRDFFSLAEAWLYLRASLIAATPARAYNGTIFRSGDVFLNVFKNDQQELITIAEPIFLTREKAAELRIDTTAPQRADDREAEPCPLMGSCAKNFCSYWSGEECGAEGPRRYRDLRPRPKPSLQPAPKPAGFTFIELAICLAIAAILLMAAVPDFMASVYRARLRQDQLGLRNLGIAVADYSLDMGGDLSLLNNAGPLEPGSPAWFGLSPYAKAIYRTDAWGGQVYLTTAPALEGVRGITGATRSDWLLEAFGSDHGEGPTPTTIDMANPESGFWTPGKVTAYANDIVIFSGDFVGGPRSLRGQGLEPTPRPKEPAH
jgi:prepilin-type N-terminal cleavage/methylation domain-containing protein